MQYIQAKRKCRLNANKYAIGNMNIKCKTNSKQVCNHYSNSKMQTKSLTSMQGTSIQNLESLEDQ